MYYIAFTTMKKSITLFAYFLASIIIIGFFAQSLSVLIDRNTPKPTSSAREQISSTYTVGVCSKDTDCFLSGCGGEYCASEEVISTCEVKPDAPSDDFRCGCYDNRCAWILK